MCLDVASGEDVGPLLEQYVKEHGGPGNSELDFPSANWFVQDETMLITEIDAMDVDVPEGEADEADGADENNQDVDMQETIGKPRSESGTTPPRTSSTAPETQKPPVVVGDKRQRQASPLVEPERRSTRTAAKKAPAVQAPAGGNSSGRRTKKTKVDHPGTKSVDPMSDRMQLVFEVHKKFVRLTLLFVTTKANDEISILRVNTQK